MNSIRIKERLSDIILPHKPLYCNKNYGYQLTADKNGRQIFSGAHCQLFVVSFLPCSVEMEAV